jgi:D-alanyl-D-alanine carboxypeptidase
LQVIILFKRFAAAFLALSLIFTVNAYAFDCSAASAIVMDAVTSEILYQKNANEKRSIASTTKIMTALLACESGRLNETVQITFDMVNTFGTLLGLRENDKITLRDLVKGMLLRQATMLQMQPRFSSAAALRGLRR